MGNAKEKQAKTLEQFREIVREENKELVGGMLPKCHVNYFRQVERMLEIYKPMKAILADEAAYFDVEYHERSKDIVKSSIGGGTGGTVSEGERLQELVQKREAQYTESKDQFERIERIIRQFEGLREFAVIRLYYFGEYSDGTERKEPLQRYTWDEVAEALGKDTRTVRRWKNNIINRMAACIGGLDAIKAEAIHWAKGELDKMEQQ
jgi:hypothetical protein